jgi:hypothetical protein
MTIKPFIQQIEISFWHLAIPILQNSRIVRFLMPHIHRLMVQELSRPALLATSGCVVAGLLLGYTLGLLSHFI